MSAVCAKGRRRCPEVLALREEALQEWCEAETFEEVRVSWARLGGLVTKHRYGREHFVLLARHRNGDPEALQRIAARMRLRRSR